MVLVSGRDEKLTSVLTILPLSIKLPTYGGWWCVKVGTQSWYSRTRLFVLEQSYFSCQPALSAQVLPVLLALTSCSIGVLAA